MPNTLYSAWALQLHGDRAAARAAFDSACVRLDSALRDDRPLGLGQPR